MYRTQALQLSVFHVLEKIKEEQKELREMFTSNFLKGRHDTDTNSTEFPSDCPKLPCTSPEELALFNTYLNDTNHFSVMCKHFGSVGGSSTNNVVRRIMQIVISNPLSMQYNWRGTGGLKLAFSQFNNICKMLMVSVRKHSLFEKATDHEIENCVKKWLVYAKDREGGRSRR